MQAEQALIIFIRNPELGKVKTRLAATVGNENALRIYEELLRFTQEITENLPVRKMLFYADKIAENDTWPTAVFEKFLQPPGDLGQKMEAAFGQAFSEGAKQVMIIGSDCYELSEGIINEAFEQLEKHDAVIGPAADGGYYLLGFSRLNPGVFQHKNWSTASVFQDTVQDLEKENFSYFVLPVLNDVDEEKDLGELRKLLFVKAE
ncbi:TIGR04282 family arsenosugar biosynthesis glycosyltransferase [Adhaeribacter sp. BT258]|uniref:TIGR04282 family arsenosugar biosynthesis glycosyltransferase n=1 Tax=Adhaeribacter terrigena TaxID=2793070 RepID=A0ABS1BZU7_9BACT|nr:TIGR04282 family arsenosugar biosynthesis glycosyltransferase [Adhaeribacter terrigena]MBK0402441.1 TIGR04282 family arsenosugar biosynthesis glycosyltransferase [Adhaeribacter terrigena]